MSIKIIIIEDENLAVIRLKRLLLELDDSFEIVAEIKSVKEGLAWFSTYLNSSIDLIFSDIQLLDGLSFEIFENIKITTPIIFTTAFDTYLLKAFKTFGIEYLLKPFSTDELNAALKKYKMLKQESSNANPFAANKILKWLENKEHPVFCTFISYVKEKIIPIKSDDIIFFSLSNQAVSAHTEKNKWLLNDSLNQIEEKLPTNFFYRANRQFIIQRKYIKEIENHFNGKLKITLTIPHEEILISKDNCKHFKDWLQN